MMAKNFICMDAFPANDSSVTLQVVVAIFLMEHQLCI